MEENESTLLPLFPLSLVVFPKEKLNLHIFEPRYKQMILECEKEEKTFGIPPFASGKLHYYGTEVKLLEISKIYDDGKMDIKTEGTRIFQIVKFQKEMEPKLYPGGEVKILLDGNVDNNLELKHKISILVKELYELLEIKKEVKPSEDTLYSYGIAHHVGLSVEQKIKLLTIRSEDLRLQLIYEHMVDFLPSVKRAEEVKFKAGQNGHFKNIIPPKL